jgi:riboflavin biosynthesis pyrimidine reductase
VILRRLFPVADAPADLDSPDGRERVAAFYLPPRPDWVRLNLVGTVNGGATGNDGTSETITNPIDRVILNVIRSLADVVVIGAASVRVEGYFVPKRAALAVVTGSGDLTGHRVTSGGDRGPLLVLCPLDAVATARATVGDPNARIIGVAATDGVLSADAIVAALHEAGYRSIVVEGGPRLAAHLVAGGVVDELCLTTAPLLRDSPVSLFGALGAHIPVQVPLTLSQLLVDDGGAIYARWSIPSGD